MMSVCIWLGLFSTAITGHVTPATTSAPSVVEILLREFRGMNQKLDSIQQFMQSSYSVVGSGSGLELVTNKLLTLETKFEAVQTTLKANLNIAESRLEVVETKLEAAVTKLEAAETKLEATDTALQSTQILFKSKLRGSTFVRWGRKTCTNSSQVVYTGVAGGSLYSHTGAAANMLCLTLTPQYDGTPVPKYYGYLYGSEYEEIPGHHDHDVPCSVCRAAQSTTIMVPATQTCPVGWSTQYTGHLVAGRYTHAAASEYYCLDGYPENARNGHENNNGKLVYYVVSACGSLPCPPYTNGQVVSCVVCSK